MSLVIVGSIGLDTVESPAGKVIDALGGSALYGSIAASHFCDVRIVGVVGTDFPDTAIKLLHSRSIDTEGLEIKEGKTFRWSGKYSNFNQAETLLTELNVFASFDPKLPEACRSCHSLLLGNIHPDLQLGVLDKIDNYELVACDTMNYWINLCPEKLDILFAKVNIIFINEDEIRQYTGEKSIFTAARKLLKMGPQIIVIKRGEYGSVVISEDNLYFVPAYPIDIVKDTTGAGDSFAGGFLGYIASQGSLNKDIIRRAARYGSVLAALDVSEFSVNGLLSKDRAFIDDMESQLLSWMQ